VTGWLVLLPRAAAERIAATESGWGHLNITASNHHLLAAVTGVGDRDQIMLATQQVSMHWIRHTVLTWVERHFGFAVAQAYAGHEDHDRGGRAMASYVRAGLPEVATALAALTGEPHPLAISTSSPGLPGSDRA
jgi:hypothetical protein